MPPIRFPALLKDQWRFSVPVRQSSSFANLHSELTSRRLPLLFDDLSVRPSHQLHRTLDDFLPSRNPAFSPASSLSSSHFLQLLHGYHLVYFPPLTPLSHLLPDGTDPEQSPGEPFVHRMWAGGSIRFRPDQNTFLRKQRAVALERIIDVVTKGAPGDEKVIVTVERRIGMSKVDGQPRKPGRPARTEDAEVMQLALEEREQWERSLEQRIRESMMADNDCAAIERRNIIFLQKPINHNASSSSRKILKPPHEPTFSYAIIPTAALLFRFSALTFNAHRIHLDKQYCQEVEGHRNLLVHGPLSVVLMLEALRRFVFTHDEYKRPGTYMSRFEEIEYRNVAPLYAEEEMKICGRANGQDWDVWIEGKDGGYAVKGVVRARRHKTSESDDSKGGEQNSPTSNAKETTEGKQATEL